MGNADDMYHCDTCDACFLKAHKDRHHCLKTPLREHSCPICLESVHFSQKRSNILSCGHIAHYDCLVSYLNHHDSTSKGSVVPNCPTCRKCLLSKEDAMPFWEEMRQAIKLSPMPADWFGPVEVGDTLRTPEDGELVVQCLLTSTLLLSSDDNHLSEDDDTSTPSSFSSVKHCVGMLSTSGIIVSYPLSSLRKAHPVEALCNDCEKRCTSDYHVMGLECSLCCGFNTSRA
jgi:hypothetical protein